MKNMPAEKPPAALSDHSPVQDPVLAARSAVRDSLHRLEAAAISGQFCDSVRAGRMVTRDDEELGPVRVPLLGAGHVRIAFGESIGVPEGPKATRELMTTMLEDVVATQPRGHVRIVVCDEGPAGASVFDEFAVVDTFDPEDASLLDRVHDSRDRFWGEDAYYYREPSSLAETIHKLREDLRAREESGRLAGYGTLRDFVEAGAGVGSRPAFPWRVAALMGSGKALDQETQKELDYLIAVGPRYGVSLMLGGGIRPTNTSSNVTNLRVGKNRWVGYEHERDVLIYRDRPAERETIKTVVAASRARTILPGKSMRSADELKKMREHLFGMRTAQEQLEELAKLSPSEFPYFNRHFLEKVFRPEEQAEALATIFSPAIDTVTETSKAAKMALNAAPTADWGAGQVMAWSTYALALANNPRDQRYAPNDLTEKAQEILDHYLPHLDRLASFIINPASMPGPARRLLAEYLPGELPAWLFHALAEAYPDENFWPAGRCPESRLDLDSAPALMAHLVKRYYPEDYQEGSWLNDRQHPVREPSALGALVELELMRLYGWFDNPQMPEKLRTALFWRAIHRSTGVLYPEALPEEAKMMREQVMAYSKTLDHDDILRKLALVT